MELKNIKLMMGNIRNLIPNSNRNKVKILEDMASMDSVGIIMLCESHLNSDIDDAEISMINYYCHRVDRVNRSHGGVITYVRNDIDSTKILEFSDGYIELVGILVKSLNVLPLQPKKWLCGWSLQEWTQRYCRELQTNCSNQPY